MKSMLRMTGIFCMSACLALTGVGCSTHMQPHDVTVALAPDVKAGGDTYNVDLVGVSADESDMARMRSLGVNDYWSKSDLRNLAAHRSFTFREGDSSPKTLAAGDPIWQEWNSKGVMNLFVIADLPDAPADKTGDQDTRRVIIPLKSDRWDGAQKITVSLRRSAIDYSPKPKEEKK